MIPDGCKGIGLKVWMCQDLLHPCCLHLTAPHEAGMLKSAHHKKLVKEMHKQLYDDSCICQWQKGKHVKTS